LFPRFGLWRTLLPSYDETLGLLLLSVVSKMWVVEEILQSLQGSHSFGCTDRGALPAPDIHSIN
jgi:hypothetical protein